MEAGDSIPVGLPPSFLPSLSIFHPFWLYNTKLPQVVKSRDLCPLPQKLMMGTSSSVISAGLSNVSDGTSPTTNFSFANDFPCGIILMSYYT